MVLHDMMEESLLSSAAAAVTDDESLSGTDDESLSGEKISWEEIKKLLKIALPMIIMNMLQYSLQMVSTMIVGHIDELSLAAVSLGTSFANVMGFSIMLGLASGLNTLCGQTFGAKQYRLHGIFMQRAIFVLFCTSIPLSIIWFFLEQILLAIGQDPSISSEAGLYTRWLIPSLIADVFLQPITMFLQTQSLVMPMMLVSALSLVIHAPICWFMVYKIDLRIRGAALSTCISYWLNVALLSLYIKFSAACEKTRTPLSKKAFVGITNFLKISIPALLMSCLDWWSFEILILLSGILPNPQLETSVLSICVNTATFSYMIPNGICAAASTRVSNELGAGNTRDALLAARSVMCVSLTEIIIRGATLLLLRNTWGSLYSNDPEVIKYTSTMMPIVALSSMMDGLQATLSGIAMGCGLQQWGAFVNLAAYYILGLPLAAALAFVIHLGAKGLWLGTLGGFFCQTISLLLVNVCHDWNKLARQARKRAQEYALLLED